MDFRTLFKGRAFLTLAAALCVSQPLFATEPVASLRQFLSQTTTLQAKFTQVVAQVDSKTEQKSTGTFYLQRPGKFRWDYLTPYRQVVVSSSDKVWFYDEDLAQVTTKRLNQAIGATPALLLSSNVPLEENFVVEANGTDEGLDWVRLKPKAEDAGFQYVLIGLNHGQLAGMELRDAFGSNTRIYFSELKSGMKIPADRFSFTPPPGVDVFNGD